MQINHLFRSARSRQIYPLKDLEPLYHSYRLFGVSNKQLSRIYELNQACKEPIIMAYIQYALAKSDVGASRATTFVELFCGDGYYAMLARYLGAAHAWGIDNDRDGHFKKAAKIADRLKIDNCTFCKMNVDALLTLSPVDIVANVGGLYHVDNPEEILDKSYALARRFLIVQSVVSLGNDAEGYFECPAPGWTWGNRYSRRSFDRMMKRKGWNIVDAHFNELEGNPRPEDRGSLYYLVKK